MSSGYRGRSSGRSRGRGGGSRGGRDNSSGGGYYNNQGGGNRGYYNRGYRNRGRRGRGGDKYSHDGDEPGPRSRLLDDDISMDGDDDGQQKPRNRYSPYGSRPDRQVQYRDNRSNRGGGSRAAMDRQQQDLHSRLGSQSSRGSYKQGGYNNNNRKGSYNARKGPLFYQINIPHGDKVEKNWLIQQLMSICGTAFVPLYYRKTQRGASFFVDDAQTARALTSCSRKITSPNGFKLVITSRQADPPIVPLDNSAVEKIKAAMADRYDGASQALRLDNFFSDAKLNADGHHIALSKPNNMEAVLKIIKENIPQLRSLDLSDNRMYSLIHLRTLHEAAPDLKALNLGKNELKSKEALQDISKLDLEELILNENPFLDDYKDSSSYISAIRKKFPKIMILDGHDLPPPITFEVENPMRLPPTLGCHYGSEEAQRELDRFLDIYFQVFDTDRQQLLDAYDDNAVFSMTVAFNKLGTKTPGWPYMMDSRNLMKVKDEGKREKLMKVGKLNVVAMLSELPKTEHDRGSRVIDVAVATELLVVFTVNGIFRETLHKGGTMLRAFSRLFVVRPQPRIMILNDELAITTPTREQEEKAFTTPIPPPQATTPTPSTSVVSSPQLPQGTPPVQVPVSPAAPERQLLMVQEFARQSGMNEGFSQRCLQENGWDYQKAAEVFQNLHSQGKIPPEAFVK